jgi:hypothetical protein
LEAEQTKDSAVAVAVEQVASAEIITAQEPLALAEVARPLQ